jgi:mannitol/fructose-specific phosphotransferase system IIA component (Ntr-type)
MRSSSFDGALRELVLASNLDGDISLERIVSVIAEHDRTVTMRIGYGVVVPHTRLNLNIPMILAFGRCKNGLFLNAADKYNDVPYVILMLSANNDRTYLNTLTGMVYTLQNSAVIDSFNRIHSLDALKERGPNALASPQNTKPRIEGRSL